jgi:nucleoside-diphosphate-sugar epimerase
MTEQAAVRWLILGSGFVGSALAAYLESAGHVVGSLPAPRLEAGIDSDDAALANQAANHPALDGLKASMLTSSVLLAAGLATPDATASPALFGANALLPGVILRAAQSARVRRFIHLSSAAVQGRRRVLTEAVDTHPFLCTRHRRLWVNG